MSLLFETTNIKGLKLNNRFIRSATWEGMALEDGSCTSKLVEYMTDLVKGGIGLIISSHTYVRKDGQASPWQLGIYKDQQIDGLRKMTKAVHDHGGKIAIQLAHGGINANSQLTNQPVIAFSELKELEKPSVKVMTQQDIADIIMAFELAAHRAIEAGFDAIQLHAAHCYFLCQSFSPAFNKRDDGYGGSLENRSKVPLTVLNKLRSIVKSDFPLMIKINCSDFLDNGLSVEESVKIAVKLQENGIDAIELSGGTPLSGQFIPSRTKINSEAKEAYFRNEARIFKENLKVPLILVGGIRSFQIAEMLVKENYADYISMCRSLIREPDLIKRWQSGDLRKAECISDNKCFVPGRNGEGIYCVPKLKKQK